MSLSSIEIDLYNSGINNIAGVDEVGRGCLAGPVVAASVILPRDHDIIGIKDSKKLTPKKRDILFDEIASKAISYGVGLVEPVEIDEINILQAALKAMKISVGSLDLKPEFALIDGTFQIQTSIKQQAVKDGDNICECIGAASIIAKVTRDRMMIEYEKEYSDFSFGKHKGYGTKAHFAELLKYGVTKIHRRSFKGVEKH